MKLTMELLRDALENRCAVVRSHMEEGCPPVGRPLFYEPGTVAETGRLYLSAVNAEALCRPGVCTVYLEGAAPVADRGSYLCLDASRQMGLNLIQKLYDRYDRWEAELERIVLSRGTVLALLQASYSVLRNPILVMSQDFDILAQVGDPEGFPDPSLGEHGAEAVELYTALQQDALYQEMQESTAPFLYPAHILGWRSWNLNLHSQGRTGYRITLAERDQELCGGDAYLLSIMAPYVSYLLEQARATEESRSTSGLRSIFQQILSDRTADYMDMSSQLTRQGWGPENRYFSLLLQSPYQEETNISANLICSQIENRYPGCCCFPYEGNIVGFFNLDRCDATLEAIQSEMAYFIRESFLKAGYSRVLRGHSNLRRQYVQARVALEVGSRVNPYLWIHHFNTIAFPYILEQATRRLPGEMLCHEKLLVLREYDAQQKTEYMRTLRTYLDLHLNAVATAKALFIHRSTLLYRLDKIKALLESDLTDPEELLYLSISFRLLDNDQPEKE
jgi:hypothetical protein